MKIFFKYVTRCMTEKKGRLVLLVIAIAMSTGLLVTSSGTVELAISSFSKPILETFEGKDIVINSKGNDNFFDDKGLVDSGIKDLRGEIRIGGKIINDEITYITILGRENKFIEENKIAVGSLSDFNGAKCIISKRVSDALNLKIDDTLECNIAGKTKQLKIAAINSTDGTFYNDKPEQFSIIVPYEYLAKEFKAEGKYNVLFANKSTDKIEDSINKFNDSNSDFKAEKLFDEQTIKSQTAPITMVLYLMLLIVVFMSGIIIYGSFKLTITERLSVIGTFFSQGATRMTVEFILLIESIGYGIVGAVFGNVLGIGGLYLINYLISPLKDYGIIEKVNINPYHIIIGTIFAILLSLISALIPVLKIRRLQVKEVILNNVNVSMKVGWKKFIVGAGILLFSIIINFIQQDWSNVVSGIMVILSIVGLIMVYPKVVDLITTVLYKLLKGRSKALVFSLNNLRTSKILLGNITLIIVSLLSIMMITSVGTSIKTMLSDAYIKLDSDITINNISSLRTGDESVADLIIKELKGNDSIIEESIDFTSGTSGNALDNDFYIEGINPKKYKEYNGYLELNSAKYKDIIDEITESDQNLIIISKSISDTLKKEKGDKIVIKSNNVEREFTICGVIEGKFYNMGRVSFINYNVLAREFNIKSPNSIHFKTYEAAEDVKNELADMLKGYGATATTKAESMKNDAESNEMIVSILSIFAYMAVIIAALGVLNNIIIGFLQRKRELAVLSSVGMSRKNRGRMLLIESILSAVWSIVIAIPYSYLGLSLLSKFLKVVNMPLEIKLDISSIPVYFVATLIVIIVATLPVLFKSRKLSIIEELKYE